MIIRGTTGTSITEKPTIGFDSNDDKHDPDIAAILEQGTLEGYLAAVTGECFAVMQAEGLPTYFGCYVFNIEGAWRESGPPFAGHTIANEIWPIARARGHAPDSPVGFAARILSDILWLRESQASGDHDRAALFHGYVMAKKVEQRIKTEREAMWQRGVDDKQVRVTGGENTRKTADSVRVARWQHYYDQTGKKTESDRLAAKELGEGESTIRKARLDWRKAATASD